jgi:hypothetical protein
MTSNMYAYCDNSSVIATVSITRPPQMTPVQRPYENVLILPTSYFLLNNNKDSNVQTNL